LIGIDRQMRRVLLPRTGLETTRLGFGTARLHYLDRAQRRALLALALDLGVTHFDTAPAYGDGMAEAELGVALHGRRDQCILVTKYGVTPNPFIAAAPALGTPIRGVRSVARKLGLWQKSVRPFEATELRRSVACSLRRLRTDRIDILLLHEPHVSRLAAADEIAAELEVLRTAGLVRTYGLAGRWSGVVSVLDANPDLGQVVQTNEYEWEEAKPPDITFGAITAAAQRYRSAAIPHDVAHARLRTALQRRPHGVVLIATTKPENLLSMVEVQRAVDG
jgi:aryl-alcohol dehydrogenase-like predicted oxidoreductase